MAIAPIGVTHNFNGDTDASNKVDADALDEQIGNIANKTNEIISAINRFRTTQPLVGVDFVNVVQDFNATGDGVADDTAEIQAAIDSLPAGATCYLPPGTYSTSSALKLSGTSGNVSKLRFLGASKYDTIIKLTDNTNTNILEILANSDFEISNIKLIGTLNRGGTAPIPCYNWQPGLRYTRVGTRYSTRPGGAFASPPLETDVIWELTSAMPVGIESDDDSDLILDGNDLSYFTPISGTGVINNYQWDAEFTTRHGIYVTGPHGGAQVERVSIHDCEIRETVWAGICAGSGTSKSTIVTSGCTEVQICDNLLVDTGATSIGGLNRNRALISGNTIIESNGGGINVDADGSDNIIVQNIIDGGETPETTRTVYRITGLGITAGGSGFAVGDRLYVGTGTPSPSVTARFRVDSIGGGGSVATVSLLSKGSFAFSPTTSWTTSGSGTGATFTRTTETFDDYQYYGRYGISVNASPRCIVANNIIQHCDTGIKFQGSGTNIGSSIQCNIVFKCGLGIYSYSMDTSAISDNIFHDIDTHAMNVVAARNVTIANNQVYDCDKITGSGIRVRDMLTGQVVGNSIHGTASHGIWLSNCRKVCVNDNTVRDSSRLHQVASIEFDEYNGVGSSENIVGTNRCYDSGSTVSYRLVSNGIHLGSTSISNTLIGNDFTDTYSVAYLDDASASVIWYRDAGPIWRSIGGITSSADIQAGGFIRIGGDSGPLWKAGTGSPSGVVSSTIGSLFSQLDGDGRSQLWVKTLTTGSTGWRRIHDRINVAWFGAKGDNSTDDTAAIQSAFAAAAAIVDTLTNIASGSRAGTVDVYFPRGRYKYNGNTNVITNPSGGIISYGIRIVGDGPSSSQLEWNPTGTTTDEQSLFYFSPTSFNIITFDNIGLRVGNAYTKCIAIRTDANGTNGPQDCRFVRTHFYNFAHAWVADGTDLSSEMKFDQCRILGDYNQSGIFVRGTDQTLNMWLSNTSWLCTAGSFIRLEKGGNLQLRDTNAFNTSSSTTGTSGTACGCPIYCNAAAAAGALPNIRTALGNFSVVSGMTIRWADSQVFTTNATVTFSSGADTAQPTAATLATALRDKTPGIIYPTVLLSADTVVGASSASLKLSGGPTTATLKRGDVIVIGTADKTTYVVQTDVTLDTVGVSVLVSPLLTAITVANQPVHCREPAIIELLGDSHARGVTTALVDGIRIEHRNRSSRTLYSEWPNGNVTLRNIDEAVQSAGVGPMWTYRMNLGNNAGPRFVFDNCSFHGWPDIWYGSSQYDRNSHIEYRSCYWRIGNDPAVGFSFVPRSTLNSSPHANIASPMVSLEHCRGDSALATDNYVGSMDLNGNRSYRGELRRRTVTLLNALGASPIGGTTRTVYLPLGSFITKCKLYMPAGAIAAATAGCTYVLQTSDPTVHATAAPATLNAGFDVEVSPAGGGFRCDTDAKRQLQLVVSAGVGANTTTNFIAIVEYIGG